MMETNQANRDINPCVWVKQGGTADYWETNCDHLFQFNDGGPAENEFKFCCYCGNPLEAVEPTEEGKEE